MSNTLSYRHSHSDTGYGKRYNTNYSSGYYAAMFRELERPILLRIFSEVSKGRKSLLDFACGTGRITQLAPAFFERVLGVDISKDMLQNAHKDPSIQYVCKDMTREGLQEKFSVVTSFRFFLNAESELREEALKAIRAHMADDGRLVCNVHMNSRSVMGVVYRLARMMPFLPQHKTLSYAEFEKLLNSNGFAIEEVVWYGAVPRPGRFFAGFFERCLGPMERGLAKIGLNGRFSQSFIVVAKLNENSTKPNA